MIRRRGATALALVSALLVAGCSGPTDADRARTKLEPPLIDAQIVSATAVSGEGDAAVLCGRARARAPWSDSPGPRRYILLSGANPPLIEKLAEDRPWPPEAARFEKAWSTICGAAR